MKFTNDQLEIDLEEIDTFLRKEKTPIHGRPIRAASEFSKKYKISLPISKPQPGTYHESYEFWPITEFITNWFDKRYGDRLGVDMGPGKCVFLLRGDPWFFHYPLFIGNHRFGISREHSSDELAPIDGVAVYNIFESIKNLPIGLRNSTTNDELQYLLDTFSLGISALTALEEVSNNELIKTAIADFEAAVSHIMSSRSDYGLSKWSSLQSTEKILKYIIQSKNNKYLKTHDLSILYKNLKGLGIDTDLEHEISIIQCSPAIRYGEEDVNLEDAISAYHAALHVIYKLKSVL